MVNVRHESGMDLDDSKFAPENSGSVMLRIKKFVVLAKSTITGGRDTIE